MILAAPVSMSCSRSLAMQPTRQDRRMPRIISRQHWPGERTRLATVIRVSASTGQPDPGPPGICPGQRNGSGTAELSFPSPGRWCLLVGIYTRQLPGRVFAYRPSSFVVLEVKRTKSSAKILYGPKEKVGFQVFVCFRFFMKPELVNQCIF